MTSAREATPAYCSTGLSDTGDSRKRQFIATAPSKIRTTSIPTIDAGRSPAAVSTENGLSIWCETPPERSKMSGQPMALTRSASPLAGEVMATTRSANRWRSPPTLSISAFRNSLVATAVGSVPAPGLMTRIANRSSTSSVVRPAVAGAITSRRPWAESLSIRSPSNEIRGRPPRSPRDRSLCRG